MSPYPRLFLMVEFSTQTFEKSNIRTHYVDVRSAQSLSRIVRKPVYAICEQQRHPRSLISAFVVRCLDSIIPLLSIDEI